MLLKLLNNEDDELETVEHCTNKLSVLQTCEDYTNER